MSIILLSADLTVISRVQGAATATGAQVAVVSNAANLVDRSGVNRPSLVIVDLSAPSMDVTAIVQQLRASNGSARILAFGPHVHVDKLAAARNAGCDEVLSRGHFLAQLNSILRS